MFNCNRIKGVEYYYKMGADAAQAQGLSPHEVDSEGERRDYVDYLADNGAGEEPGRWLVLRARGTSPFPTPSPFATIVDGEAASGRVLRDLAAGKDPTTGEVVAQTKRLKKGQPPVDPGGYDCQLSLVKSASLLKAFGPEGDNGYKQQMSDIEAKAYRKTMQWAFEQGLFATRIDKQLVPAAEIVMGTFTHSTSRAEDPQAHIHGALMKMCVRPDGKIGMLDNVLLKKYGGAIAAYHRCEVASGIRELGFAVERDGRNFQIAGFPPVILDLFSKRRAEIEKLADDLGFDTAQRRQAAQVASYQTRANKEFTPLAELEARWDRELAGKGWTRETILESLQVAARLATPKPESDQDRRERLNGLVMAALDGIMQTNAVFTRATLYREAFEALQTEAGADEAMAVVKALEESGVLVRVASIETAEPVYSTAEMIEMEKAIMRTAFERQGEREFVNPVIIDRTIAAANAKLRERNPNARLTAEQEAAIRHVCGRDGVSLVQGLAGTGKSFSTLVSKTAFEAAGFEVWGIAPSWKATDVLRKDAQLAEDRAMAVAKFIAMSKKGEISLTKKSVVILDEAGMVGHAEMLALMEITARTGAKFILQGDKMQYAAVAAGSPFAAMQRLVGAATLEDIQRQKGRSEKEGEWMRAASRDLATGEAQQIVRALQRYDDEGRISWADDDAAAIEELANLYMRDRLDAPEATRAITTQWNSDARNISAVLRQRLREAGLLSHDAVHVNVIPRGAKEGAKPITIELSEGEQIIFGENVLVDGTMIRNADLGRIVKIAGDPEDPFVTVALEKGATVSARVSEFIGRRPEPEPGQEPAETAPMFQHAYALTGHAMQGVTVDRAFDIVLQSRGANGSYVCATRHRQDFHMIVSCERIADRLATSAPGTMAVGQAGGMKTAEEDERNAEPMLDEVKKAFFAECSGADPLGNVSDHVRTEDLREWIGVEPAKKVEARNQIAAEVAQALASRFPNPKPPPKLPPGAPPRKVASPEAPKPTPAEEMAARIALNKKSPPVPPSRRIADEEFQDFARRDLGAYLETCGFKAQGHWMRSNSYPMDYRMFHQPGGGGKISVSRWDDGTWGFYKASGGVQGKIWHFEAWRTGTSLMAAAHALRRHFGTTPGQIAPAAPKPVASSPTSSPPDAVERQKRHDYLQQIIRRNWATMSSAINQYLAKVRGIAPDLLERFRNDIRTESAGKYSVEGVACFAHRTLDGTIVGYERKGEGWQDGGRRAFSQMQAGSDKRFTMMADTDKPSRIYVAESSVDGMSIVQVDGKPKGIMIVSPYGNPSGEALEQFRELIRRNPQAEVHVAMDNDADGRRFAELFEAEVKAARGPEAGVVDRRPGEQFKDWNDQLRGITREQAAEAKAEREREEAKRRQAEEEARRQAEAANRPKMR